MRKQFISDVSEQMAREICPWASSVVRFLGGCMCFESSVEALNFCRQV